MYIKITTGKYPYGLAQLRKDNPETSFPTKLSDDSLRIFGVAKVIPTAVPLVDPSTQMLTEAPPIQSDIGWLQQWVVRQLTQEEIAANQAAAATAMQDGVVQQTQQRLDDFARTRNYDGILSACTYATSGIPQFASEGQAAVDARDATWATLYTILGEVQAGTRPVPIGFADVEAELPVLVWTV